MVGFTREGVDRPRGNERALLFLLPSEDCTNFGLSVSVLPIHGLELKAD